MKKTIFLLFIPFIIFSQQKLPYKTGEYTSYDISFEGLSVAFAEMEIKNTVLLKNTPAFHVVAKARTASFFDLFFKVRDLYETYIDTTTIKPIRFYRNIQEGGHKKTQNYNFAHKDLKVLVKDTSYNIFENTQDMLSAFFYARTFNNKNLTKNTKFSVPVFMDEENFNLDILYLYNEVLETKIGMIDCMVFKPIMQEGRVFEDGEKMKVWISNDENRLLIKVETKIWAGTIKAELINAKNIQYNYNK